MAGLPSAGQVPENGEIWCTPPEIGTRTEVILQASGSMRWSLQEGVTPSMMSGRNCSGIGSERPGGRLSRPPV